MISPYVRRLRLADEVRSLRQDAALTQEQLGRLRLNRTMNARDSANGPICWRPFAPIFGVTRKSDHQPLQGLDGTSCRVAFCRTGSIGITASWTCHAGDTGRPDITAARSDHGHPEGRRTPVQTPKRSTSARPGTSHLRSEKLLGKVCVSDHLERAKVRRRRFDHRPAAGPGRQASEHAQP